MIFDPKEWMPPEPLLTSEALAALRAKYASETDVMMLIDAYAAQAAQLKAISEHRQKIIDAIEWLNYQVKPYPFEDASRRVSGKK